jgi:hypothetical protein
MDLGGLHEPLDLSRKEKARSHDFGRTVDELIISNQTLLGGSDEELVMFMYQIVYCTWEGFNASAITLGPVRGGGGTVLLGCI